MKKNIILVGAGTHANSCFDVIELEKKYKIFGLIDNERKKKVGEYKIIGKDKDLKKIRKKVDYALVTVGLINNPKIRENLFKLIKKLKFKTPSIISPLAHVSKSASVGGGTIVFHNTIVNSNSCIGKNCIINNRALIEHDVNIGDGCHISTGAIINGNCNIGKNTFVGSGAIVSNNINILKNSFIKLGQRIIKDLNDEKRKREKK